MIFAFEQSTLPGRIVLLALFVASIFSWTVMWTKYRLLHRAQRRREQFLELFRADRQPLRIYTDRLRFEGVPAFAVYRAGCRELTFQLLGSADVDETFRGRLDTAPKISPAQMRVVTSAMERAAIIKRGSISPFPEINPVTYSPTAGPCLNPWPEPPPTSQTFSKPG